MLRNSIWRNSKFLVVGVLAIALAGGGVWNWHRQKVAEQKRETEEQVRRETLAREGRQERAWRRARAILEAAERVIPGLTDSEVWRAAQLDVARDQKVALEEMLRDLDRAFSESRSTAESVSTSLSWLIAGDIGFALYRLTEARVCYESATKASDARTSPVVRQVAARAAKVLHESGGCAQEAPHWKFAVAIGEIGDGPGGAAEAAIRLGRCSQALRQEAESVGALYSALAVTESYAEPNGREVVVPLGRLLSALTAFGRFSEAETVAHRLVALSEVHFGAEGYGTALSLLVECEMFAAQKRWPELIAASGRASKILETTAGETHPASLEAQRAMGVALFESDRAAESEKVYRALLERAEKCLPHDHFLVGSVTGQLAHAVSRLDRKAEAEGLYRGAIDIIEHSPELLRPVAADYQASLGQMFASLHRTEEAEALLRQHWPGSLRPVIVHGRRKSAYGWPNS